MKRHLVLAIAGAAFVLAVVSLFRSRGEDASSGQKDEAAAASLKKLESRLGRLEMRLNNALARLDAFSPSPASDKVTGAPEGGEGAAWELAGEMATLRSQTSTLSYRVKALEEDPANRGYTFLNSENAQLRLEGIRMLRRFARFDPATREAIRGMLQDPSERVRQEAADAVGDVGDKEAAPALEQMLADADARVREEAIQALRKVGATDAGGSIAQLLSDPSDRVREEAVQALGELGTTEFGASVAQLLSDSSDKVREEAAQALGRLKAPEGTGALLQALNDPKRDVREEAIASLGEIGAVEAVPYLRDMYETDPGGDALRLATALRALGDQEPFQREVQRFSQVALSGNDADARRRAIKTLSRFASKEARDVFTQALKDPSDRVRRDAERALHGQK